MADVPEMGIVSSGLFLLFGTEIQTRCGHYRTKAAIAQITAHIAFSGPFGHDNAAAPDQFCPVHKYSPINVC